MPRAAQAASLPGWRAPMKEAIFFAGFFLCVPVGILLVMLSRRIHAICFGALIFGTTNTTAFLSLPIPMDINFLSREWYRGTTRGIEVSYLDLLTVIVLIGTIVVRSREGRKPFFWPKSLGWMLAFLAYCCLHTIAIADPKLFALFEISKTIRGIAVFYAVALFVRSNRDLEVFLWALSAAVGYEAAVCLRDRYIYHIHRIYGTLGHPNILSLYMLMSLPFMITTSLANTKPILRAAAMLGVLAATGCVVLTISRTGFAALVLLALTCGAATMGLKINTRNVAIIAFASLAFLGVLARSWDTIESRLFSYTLEDEFGEDTTQGRGVYFRYLFAILQDKPLGVGYNNWSYAVTNEYASREGVIYNPYINTSITPSQDMRTVSNTMGGTQAAPAHNIFVITMGELGWPGIFLFLGFTGTWLYMGARFLAQRSDALISRFGLAAFFSVAAIMLQGMTEWEFRITPIFLLAHIIAGALAAVYQHRFSRA